MKNETSKSQEIKLPKSADEVYFNREMELSKLCGKYESALLFAIRVLDGKSVFTTAEAIRDLQNTIAENNKLFEQTFSKI
jgi:hypothetical protein